MVDYPYFYVILHPNLKQNYQNEEVYTSFFAHTKLWSM